MVLGNSVAVAQLGKRHAVLANISHQKLMVTPNLFLYFELFICKKMNVLCSLLKVTILTLIFYIKVYFVAFLKRYHVKCDSHFDLIEVLFCQIFFSLALPQIQSQK